MTSSKESKALAVRLGEGTLPYSLLLFCFAVLIEPATACSLLLGAYACGMAGDLERQLPSGLKGYKKPLAALLFGLLFLPWHAVVWGATSCSRSRPSTIWLTWVPIG